jgi:death on curing protein
VILERHDEAIRLYGGDPGILKPGLLDFAVARPWTELGGETVFKTAFEKAAAIAESIIRNHIFLDGNKRTALVAADMVMGLHGLRIDATTTEKVETILALTVKTLSFEEFVVWLGRHSAPL